MARLRTNFQSGSITDNPVALGATAVNSPAFATLPVVTAPDVLAVELDPQRVAGAAEIVWVTGHTAGATTITVLRGMEGSAARIHNQGERWVAGPVVGDWWGGGQTFYSPQTVDGPTLLQNSQNVIPLNQSLLLSGNVGWQANSNGTIQYIPGGGADVYTPGEGAIQITVTSTLSNANIITSGTPNPGFAFPAVAGNQYWFRFRAQPAAGTTARNVEGKLIFYDSGGVQIGSSVAGAPVLEVVGAWVSASVVTVAPANTAYMAAAAEVENPTAAEHHLFSAFELGPGQLPTQSYLPPVTLRVQSLAKRDLDYVDQDMLSIETQGYGDQNNYITRYSDTSWSKAFWSFRRTRGTKAAPADVQAGDWVGGNRFWGLIGGVWQGLGDVVSVVDTVSGTQASGEVLIGADNLGGSAYGASLALHGGGGYSQFVGNVGMGMVPVYPLDILSADNGQSSGMRVTQTADLQSPQLVMRRAMSDGSAPTSGKTLGGIVSYGATAVGSYSGGAYIAFVASENFGAAAGGAHIYFYTTAPGTITPLVKRMEIDDDGQVGIGMVPGFQLDVAGEIRVNLAHGRLIADDFQSATAGSLLFRQAVNVNASSTSAPVHTAGALVVLSTAGTNSNDIVIQRPGSLSATNVSWTWSNRTNNTSLELYAYDGTTFAPKLFFDYNNATEIWGNWWFADIASLGFNRNPTNGAIGNSANNAWQIVGGNPTFTIQAYNSAGVGQAPIFNYSATEKIFTLVNGNSSGLFTSRQIAFGWNGGQSYRHAIGSRHDSGSNAANALDFHVWTTADAAGAMPSFRVASLGGDGTALFFGSSRRLRVAFDGSFAYLAGEDTAGALVNGNLYLQSGSIYQQLYNASGDYRWFVNGGGLAMNLTNGSSLKVGGNDHWFGPGWNTGGANLHVNVPNATDVVLAAEASGGNANVILRPQGTGGVYVQSVGGTSWGWFGSDGTFALTQHPLHLRSNAGNRRASVAFEDSAGTGTWALLTDSPVNNTRDVGLWDSVNSRFAWSVDANTVVSIRPPAIGFPTYVNGWTDYDGNVAWRQARFFIDAQQFVHLEGLIKNATTTQTGVIFTLPVGYRPSKNVLFIAMANTNGYARIDIQSDGSVILQLYGGGGGAGYVSLSGITFSLQA